MCTNPLKILSRKSTYRDGIDKFYYQVPCGRCWQCINKKADDWYIRSAYEYMRVIELGGYVLFPTLTYNDSHVPFLNINDGTYDPLEYDDKMKLPIFNGMVYDKRHLKRFFRNIRQLLNGNNEYFSDIPNIPFKYFVTSEFGSKLKRPHYHVNLYFDKKIVNISDPAQFEHFTDLLQIAWSDRVGYDDVPVPLRNWLEKCPSLRLKSGHLIYTRDYFPHDIDWSCEYAILPPKAGKKKYQVYHLKGYVSWPKRDGVLEPAILSPAGCRYVSKYIQKQTFFEDEYNIKILRDFYRQVERPYNGDHKDLLDEIYYSLPFTMSSNLFGEKLEKELLASYNKGKIEDFYKHPVTIDGDTTKHHNVPAYFINRIFYQNLHYVEYGNDADIRLLTPIGAKCLSIKFERSVHYFTESMKGVFSGQYLELFPKEIFKDISDDIVNVKNLCRTVNYKCVSLYLFLFKDVCDDFLEKFGVVINNDEDLLNFAPYFFQSYVDGYNDIPIILMSPCDFRYIDRVDYYKKFCNHWPIFHNYDFILKVYESIQEVCNKYFSKLDKESEEAKRITRYNLGLTY